MIAGNWNSYEWTERERGGIATSRIRKMRSEFVFEINGKHPTGNCSRCNVPETNEHFILLCHDNLELVTQFTRKCLKDNLGVEIAKELKNEETMEMTIDYSITIEWKIWKVKLRP